MRQRVTICSVLLAALVAWTAGAAFAATNAETEQAIQSALVEKLGTDAKTIRVAFFDGKAVLSGQVTEDWVQELAKEVALYVPGVTKVENQVEAKKERKLGTGKVVDEGEDAALETEVKNAVHQEIGTHSTGVEVEACDGVVSLRGTVPDQARHDLALAAATKVKGVKKVVDLLRNAG